jgi:chromosome transmission fidelity protein 18
MAWVKQWDWCVFGKTRGKKRTRDDDENVDLDEYRRPQEKVRHYPNFLYFFDNRSVTRFFCYRDLLDWVKQRWRMSWLDKLVTKSWRLMQGWPPVKSYIYLFLKFDSDARSGTVVDDRIRPALESGFAVGSAKPVLLVIDEIDGATGTGENVGAA